MKMKFNITNVRKIVNKREYSSYKVSYDTTAKNSMDIVPTNGSRYSGLMITKLVEVYPDMLFYIYNDGSKMHIWKKEE